MKRTFSMWYDIISPGNARVKGLKALPRPRHHLGVMVQKEKKRLKKEDDRSLSSVLTLTSNWWYSGWTRTTPTRG